MICKIKETIKRHKMLSNSSKVIVGFSGGADSCALLHVLCSLKGEYSLEIIAAHVNHGIRGQEALRDENFVKDFCKALGVKLEILHCNVPEMAKKEGMGLEEYGRKIRYEFFHSIDEKALVATAHNLNDCCETLLFNITRGSSVKGLCSIPPVRGNIIRPLIACTRDEIEAYCDENSISYMNDSTNKDRLYARNKIRLDVIPQLKTINPSFEAAASRLIESACEDDEYFSLEVERLFKELKKEGGFNARLLREQPPSIRKRALAQIIEKETGIAAVSNHIQSVDSILSGGKTQISGALSVSVKDDLLFFGEAVLTKRWSSKIDPEKEIITPIGSVKVEIINKSEVVNIQFVHKNMLDYDNIVGSLTARSRLEGDEIKIANRGCTKKIKKMLVEAKIADKNSVCILADDLGPVWVEGFGCAQRCKITKNTSKILKAEIKRGS